MMLQGDREGGVGEDEEGRGEEREAGLQGEARETGVELFYTVRRGEGRNRMGRYKGNEGGRERVVGVFFFYSVGEREGIGWEGRKGRRERW